MYAKVVCAVIEPCRLSGLGRADVAGISIYIGKLVTNIFLRQYSFPQKVTKLPSFSEERNTESLFRAVSDQQQWTDAVRSSRRQPQ